MMVVMVMAMLSKVLLIFSKVISVCFFIYISLIFAKVGGVDMVDFLSLEFEYVGRMQYVGRNGSFM